MLNERVEVLREHLEAEAGKDSLQDRFHCGFIAAYNEIIKMSVGDIT